MTAAAPAAGGRDPHERAPAAEPRAGDSGQVEYRADGSVSIPIFEEELVCEKRLVVKERIVVRKETVTEDQVVEADLRRERVEVDADPEVEFRGLDQPAG